MAETILIVEDDPSILRGLELNLGLEGFAIHTATTGRAGLDLARKIAPDLILLDVMLPELNGYDICQRLRDDGVTTPIVLLSAKSTEVDKVLGLDLGADDYITKPFSLNELIARIKAHLRRRDRGPVHKLTFGDVQADLEHGQVMRRGEVVDLTARELELLKFLAERDGQILTREVILAHVWGQKYFGTDRTVDNFITRLRTKLDGDGGTHFQTVRGLGYRFKAER